MVSKIEEIPSLSKALDDFKLLSFNCPTRADEILNYLDVPIFNPISKKKASLVPLRELLQNTNESVNQLTASSMKKIETYLNEYQHDGAYTPFKDEIKNFILILKKTKTKEDVVKVFERIKNSSSLQNIFNIS